LSIPLPFNFKSSVESDGKGQQLSEEESVVLDKLLHNQTDDEHVVVSPR